MNMELKPMFTKDQCKELLVMLNDTIHRKNKKLKYCYNPMLIHDTAKTVGWQITNMMRTMLNDNKERFDYIMIALLGNFAIDTVTEENEERSVYSNRVTHVSGVNGLTDSEVSPITKETFINTSEAAVILDHPTRKDTYQGILVLCKPIENKEEKVEE